MVSVVDPDNALKLVDAAIDARKAFAAGRSTNPMLSAKEQIEQAGGMTVSGARALKANSAQAQQAAHHLEWEARRYQPTAVDTALGTTGSISGMVGLIPFIGPMVLKGIGGSITAVGGWVGSKGMQNVGGTIKKPAVLLTGGEYVSNGTKVQVAEGATFADIGNKLGISKPLGLASEKVADAAGWVGERVPYSIRNRFISSAEGGAQKHFSAASRHAEGLNLGAIPEAQRGAIAELHAHLLTKPNMRDAANVAVKGAATKPLAETVAGAEAAISSLKGSAVPKDVLKNAERMVTSAGKMSDKLSHASGWSNPGAAVRSVPGKIASTNAMHGLMNGAFVAQSVVSMAGDARSAGTQMKMLKEMYADMAGVDVNKVSNSRVLLGSVPEPVARARKALAAQYLLKGAADTTNIIINTKQAINHKFSFAKIMLGFLAAEGISHVADGMVADHTAEAYVAFKQAYLASKASGQPLGAEQYAEFIGMVSPELAKRGGGHSRFAQEVGKEYAEAGVSPTDIMKEVASGKLMARVHNAMDAAEKAKAAQAPEVSHAAQVRGDAPARAHKPVVGKHTEDIVAASQTGQQASVVRG
ncbi:MAG: hypothetical protein SFW63_08150 [Alphaproteobacteria bacterium]|nr:hypothetical protein [Alphaproteobacteria bacterium]